MNWMVIDNEMTPWRKKVKDLQTQLGSGNSKDCFNCEDFPKCKESVDSNADIRQGDWTYVGHQYGKALIKGKKARVLFVSMERPWDGEEEYRWQDFKATQQGFREGAYTRSNPHMGGVDAELTYLLDKTTSPADRCQQFALTNAVRCVPYFPNSDAQSTPEMQKNCSNHTKEIIKVLKPDIIITQGAPTREAIYRLFCPSIIHNQRYSQEIVKVGFVDKRVFLFTPHPAFYTYPDNSFKWKWKDLPTDLLEEAFKKVRERFSAELDAPIGPIEETMRPDNHPISRSQRQNRNTS